MDPVSAFSLAANVIQFVDFGTKFVSLAWKIYATREESLSDIQDLDKITSDLQNVLQSLQSSGETGSGSHDAISGVFKLAESCQKVAAELVEGLLKLKLPDKLRKRDALKTAFKFLWKMEDIRSLQVRLDSFRKELSLNLLVSLREHSRKSLSQQDMILQRLGVIDEGSRKLQGIGTSVLDFVASKIDSTRRDEQKKALQQQIFDRLYQSYDANSDCDSSTVSISDPRCQSLQALFLARLQFNGMDDRENRIAKAYESTFEWIFEDRGEEATRYFNFKEWLRSDNNIYWITGKAGSGKSTLVKYICQPIAQEFSRSSERQTTPNSRSYEYLAKWAGPSGLIIASFYFWNSGTDLQMTQSGLLLSLLHQILGQCPDVIPFVSAARWEALCLFGQDPRDLNVEELRQMLWNATKELSTRSRVCLFIDGLDEFDGNPDDLVSLLKDILANPNIKACVASRPWVEFEDAFKHSPSLRLEDLTYDDIKHYVTSNFHDDPGFAQLQLREPTFADQLIESIVSKSSGVFLWVHLVVGSLLAGLSYGDRVSDLQRRLNLLPPDLENLYDKILSSLDPFYLEHAAQYFALVKESENPPSLLVFSFADEECPSFVLNQPVLPLSDSELSLRVDTIRRRLNSRCKGLLEVEREAMASGSDTVRQAHLTIQYLHRTVKDYIESEKVHAMFRAAMKSPFHSHLRLCAGYLSCFKTLQNEQLFDNDSIPDVLQSCFYHAKRVAQLTEIEMISLLDELDNAGSTLAKRVAGILEQENATGLSEGLQNLYQAGLWTLSSRPSFQRGGSLLEDGKFGRTFLSLAISNDIIAYVQKRVKHGCLVQRASDILPRQIIWPLLLDAVWAPGLREKSSLNPKMIECLLDMGADPNFMARNRSPWIELLKRRPGGSDPCWPWRHAVTVMIRHGADMSLKQMTIATLGQSQVSEYGRDIFKQEVLDVLVTEGLVEPNGGRVWNYKAGIFDWFRIRVS